MDNKVTVFNVSNPEEDPSAKKKTVGTHTNFMSCCLFPNSDQQVVYSFLWGMVKKSGGKRVHKTDEIYNLEHFK